jgi:aspartyl-tRNA(Asn)/glutamyl-tRNA(Gln) amidotransferase subunit A
MAKPADDSLFYSTIPELNGLLRKREISARELTRTFADRLEKLGTRYNALAYSLEEWAIKQAKDVDGDIKRERFRGLLQGIPFGAKDLLAVKGLPTSWGAQPFLGQVFDHTATVLNKIAKSGGLLIGKLAMVELAGAGGYRSTSASISGPGRNPWDTTRWSGGSSSGSGAAVAAGLVPYALGSETSGSILTPSAYCGVTGLRPTYGLVSRYGAMPLSWTLDKIGPMCRTAEDCGLVLAEIAGKDGEDPGSAGKSFYYAPQFAKDLKMLNAGIAPVDFEGWAEPAMREPFKQALAVLREIGLKFQETALPEFPYKPVVGTIIRGDAASVFEDLITSGRVDQLADPYQAAGLKAAYEMPAHEYLRAMRVRRLIMDAVMKMFARLDVLIAPARYEVAPKLGQPLDADRTPQPNPTSPGLTALIPAGNLAGLPALCLPCGFADGMPVALQIVGRPWSENTLLSIGKEFQARTEWHKQRAPTLS